MRLRALRIATDTTVTEVDLPETGALLAIRDHIGTTDAVDQGIYHRLALLHVHGAGRAIGLEQNLAAWALASAWRGTVLYPIHGPVVVTGRTRDGEVAALEDGLARHVHTTAQTVRETLGEWRSRPPASSEAALHELLANVTRGVVPGR
ncbi:hypothetical protein [Streptomyces sp. NPDC059786]|uniref:hypothetical protein n=1 Tax=Streptomyces sp. NPDC059786 TaxID=3346946 RepID=UPI00364ED457